MSIAIDDPPNSRLFVVAGRNTSADFLRSVFEQYGVVSFVKYLREKGVAYVKYDRASSAAMAIEDLHEVTLNEGRGPRLKVMLADAPHTRALSMLPTRLYEEDVGSSTDPDNVPPRSRLFMVVPKSADGALIEAEMEAFGGMQYCKTDLIESKGIVFVKYARSSTAFLVIERVSERGMVAGYKVKIMLAEPKTRRGGPGGGSTTPPPGLFPGLLPPSHGGPGVPYGMPPGGPYGLPPPLYGAPEASASLLSGLSAAGAGHPNLAALQDLAATSGSVHGLGALAGLGGFSGFPGFAGEAGGAFGGLEQASALGFGRGRGGDAFAGRGGEAAYRAEAFAARGESFPGSSRSEGLPRGAEAAFARGADAFGRSRSDSFAGGPGFGGLGLRGGGTPPPEALGLLEGGQLADLACLGLGLPPLAGGCGSANSLSAAALASGNLSTGTLTPGGMSGASLTPGGMSGASLTPGSLSGASLTPAPAPGPASRAHTPGRASKAGYSPGAASTPSVASAGGRLASAGLRSLSAPALDAGSRLALALPPGAGEEALAALLAPCAGLEALELAGGGGLAHASFSSAEAAAAAARRVGGARLGGGAVRVLGGRSASSGSLLGLAEGDERLGMISRDERPGAGCRDEAGDSAYSGLSARSAYAFQARSLSPLGYDVPRMPALSPAREARGEGEGWELRALEARLEGLGVGDGLGLGEEGRRSPEEDRPSPRSPASPAPDACVVYSELARPLPDYALSHVFGRVGDVEYVRLLADDRTAVVRYREPGAASRAVGALNGAHVLGEVLAVSRTPPS